ncbi:MAG: type II toxin-antitoxin system RelE/ParE family toxin [Bacteroidales bacterium]|nr:type II toxin-antitoxin system RelE/ParE family toxin [Bacteroidales bacterium]
MRIFKTKDFDKDASGNGVPDNALVEAARRAEAGLLDAELGKFLIKQRIARTRSGRSRGFRAIAVFRKNDLAVFVHLFGKNEKSSLSPAEEGTFREAAKIIAALPQDKIAALVAAGEWIEVEQ